MPSVQQWLRLLSSSNPALRKRAVDGLLPYLEQVPLTVLLELLDRPPSPDVRGAVVGALGRCRDETLGLPDAAKACRLAGEQIPPEILAGGYERCSQWMDTLTEDQLEALFERSDRLFPDWPGEINAPLAAYIREHGLAEPG